MTAASAQGLGTHADITWTDVAGIGTRSSAVESGALAVDEANILAENSPVVLYRLRGEPALPLMYLSHDVVRFGLDRDALLESPNWITDLVDAADRGKIAAAIARMLEPDVPSASVEFRLHAGDGTRRLVENRFIPVRDRNGRLVEVEGIIRDVTGKRVAEDEIARLTGLDAHTGLASMATFCYRLRHAFASAERGAMPFAVLRMSLDYFRSARDRPGRAVDEALLKEIARHLMACLNRDDLIARAGDHELAVLHVEMSETIDAVRMATKFQAAVAAAHRLSGNVGRITTSVGICPYSRGSTAAHALLAGAGCALRRARHGGGNRICFASDEVDQSVFERMALADDLEGAIGRGEFELQYQPEVELSSGNIIGMEGLLRWHHPARGLIPPSVFMPIAERFGTMAALSHWVLEEACRQMRAWRDEGVAPLMIAINLSLCELDRSRTFVCDVRETMAKWQLAPSDLEFDVTEATLTRLAWTHNDVLRALRELGVKIAIDDFGSEFASFDYVSAYGVNHLKISRSITANATSDAESAETICSIIDLASKAGIGVIAQGVETEQQCLFLAQTNRATKAQGFHFSKAVSAAQAGELLRRGYIA
ncbi:putative bifunctional diguanylate cyclase/phosphodiesterase [Burkholderia sp. AW49-1]